MSRIPGLTLPADLTPIAAKARAKNEALRNQYGIEPRPWYRITNQAADEAEVMLYDEVGGWLGATADEFINDLRGITASKILLRVNSPGGSVTEGIAIANALRSHPANVTVQVDGVAASIASVIAMAGDHVRMMPNALLMVHEASGLCVGEAVDMIKMAELLDKISDNIAGAYAARAGGSEAEWRQVMKNETWYRGEEAVKAGLADEAVPVPQRGGEEPAEPEMRKQFDLTAYGYQGPTPTPAPEAPAPTLTIDIGSLLGDEVVEALRAKVAGELAAAQPETPEPAVTAAPDQPETVEEPAPVPVEEPSDETEPPVDAWASIVAHLTQPDPDPWAELVNNLTKPTASSSAATEA